LREQDYAGLSQVGMDQERPVSDIESPSEFLTRVLPISLSPEARAQGLRAHPYSLHGIRRAERHGIDVLRLTQRLKKALDSGSFAQQKVAAKRLLNSREQRSGAVLSLGFGFFCLPGALDGSQENRRYHDCRERGEKESTHSPGGVCK
jgi:hypothetical protein